MDTEKQETQYVRTITSGWRVTLPAPIRKAKGWETGALLPARASRDWMLLYADTYESNQYDHYLYLGAGGKIAILREIREKTGWAIGERLSIKDEGDHVILSTCCERNRCRSCGTNKNVIEVIDNLFLCQDCWNRYVSQLPGSLARGQIARYNQ